MRHTVFSIAQGNAKVLIGRTIQITSIIFYFTIVVWTQGFPVFRVPLQATWGIMMLAGLILVLVGKHEERKQKLGAGTTGKVSLRPH